jgi:hypothetical protein
MIVELNICEILLEIASDAPLSMTELRNADLYSTDSRLLLTLSIYTVIPSVDAEKPVDSHLIVRNIESSTSPLPTQISMTLIKCQTRKPTCDSASLP